MRIDDPSALENLIDRLQSLDPEAERRWGTLSAGEMLCHLADGNDWLRGRRQASATELGRARPVLKWIALYSPLRWARGAATDPAVDPKADGTRPADFEFDRSRVIEGLRALADLAPENLPERHPLFGPMSPEDWYRSAFRHYDHHLRQFGA